MHAQLRRLNWATWYGRRADLRAVVGAMVCGAGLLAGIAALEYPDGANTVGATAARSGIELPDWIVLITVSFWLCALLLVLATLSRAFHVRRRRGSDDDLYERWYEVPAASPAVLSVLLFLAVVPVVLIVRIVLLASGHVPRGETVGNVFGASTTRALDTAEPVWRAYSTFTGDIIGGFALLTATVALAFAAWLRWGGWLPWSLPRASCSSRPQVHEVIEESPKAEQLEHDPRLAILGCYRRFETMLIAQGLARAPWQTVTEFGCRLLQHSSLPRDAVLQLLRLFDMARYSQHVISAEDREAAWRSLLAIKASFDREDSGVISS